MGAPKCAGSEMSASRSALRASKSSSVQAKSCAAMHAAQLAGCQLMHASVQCRPRNCAAAYGSARRSVTCLPLSSRKRWWLKLGLTARSKEARLKPDSVHCILQAGWLLWEDEH